MKKTFFASLFVFIAVIMTACGNSPIEKLFSSEESLRSGLLDGQCFASADKNCLILFRGWESELDYKIFFKEDQGGWHILKGNFFHVTYNADNQLCVEFGRMSHDATGIFTPGEFILKIGGRTLTFKDFSIITVDEGDSIYEEGDEE